MASMLTSVVTLKISIGGDLFPSVYSTGIFLYFRFLLALAGLVGEKFSLNESDSKFPI